MCLGLPLGARVCSLHLLSGTGRDSYARLQMGSLRLGEGQEEPTVDAAFLGSPKGLHQG